MKMIATCLGVTRSHLHDRLRRTGEAPPKPRKAEDEAVIQLIRRLVEERPTYGYRRITALLRRQLARENGPAINHKRVFRIMRQHGLLLARHTAERVGRTHDGKVIVMRSNLRWCSDGLEFTCWNGDVVRMAFAIDAHDREIIAWRAITGGGISGDMIRDMMLEAVETRFGGCGPHTPSNGSQTTAARTPPRRHAPLRRPSI